MPEPSPGRYQSPVRCRGVDPCVAKGFETGLLAGDRRERVQQVAGGSRETVEPCHRHRVAGVEVVEHLPAVAVRASHLLAVDLCTAGCAKLLKLASSVWPQVLT